MKNLLRKSIKTAFVFAIIGAAVATAMPFVISGLVGMGALAATATTATLGTLAAATIVHTTGVFGLFGLLVPPIEKIGDAIFGKDKTEEKSHDVKKPSTNLMINQDIDVDARSVNFVAQLEEARHPELPQQRY